jgi:hypothetical protein
MFTRHYCCGQEFSIFRIKEFAVYYLQITLRSHAAVSVDLFVNEITEQRTTVVYDPVIPDVKRKR